MNNEFKIDSNCQEYSVEQFKANHEIVSNSCSFFHLNIRSLSKHYDDLVTFLEMLHYNFSFLALTETWLRSNTDSSLFNLPEYNMLTSNRENSQGGGVALYIH